MGLGAPDLLGGAFIVYRERLAANKRAAPPPSLALAVFVLPRHVLSCALARSAHVRFIVLNVLGVWRAVSCVSAAFRPFALPHDCVARKTTSAAATATTNAAQWQAGTANQPAAQLHAQQQQQQHAAYTATSQHQQSTRPQSTEQLSTQPIPAMGSLSVQVCLPPAARLADVHGAPKWLLV